MKSFKKLFKSNNNHMIINDNTNKNNPLKNTLEENIKIIKKTLGESSDLVIKVFQSGKEGNVKTGIFYTEGLSDKTLIHDFILKILMIDINKNSLQTNISSKTDMLQILKNFVIPDGEICDISNFENIFTHLLSGDTIIIIDQHPKGYVISSKEWKDRGVQEASSQTVVRGPKDSFCETLRTNTALLRRRIKDTNLWIETIQIGQRTKTDVAIAYINDIANDKIVQEVRNRLNNINIDGILESGYIEELIQDETYTPFPTVNNTERPDAAAAALLEGRIVILIDGTPFVLVVPALFVHFLHCPEDYYQRYDISTLIRLLRLSCFLIAMLTPSIYIAITTFHHEMLPTSLLINLAAQREGIPFPAFSEALIMEVAFEILREAGIRMPRVIGPAISIVGALVLGEAAVQAGIVSAVMVIIVSITAISSFVIPSYNLAISVRLLRFIFMLLAATLGIYGISIGFIALILHMCSLHSFGIPYMSPLGPSNLNDQKDTILRFPFRSMFTRPHFINPEDTIRQQRASQAKPKPPNI
ncbi:MAG: spore germination protein [Eubacteriaceae bacterium]